MPDDTFALAVSCALKRPVASFASSTATFSTARAGFFVAASAATGNIDPIKSIDMSRKQAAKTLFFCDFINMRTNVSYFRA